MSWDPIPCARSLAPTAFAAWDALKAEATLAVDGALIALIRDRVAVLFGGEAVGGHVVNPAIPPGCAEAVEQFVIDVSAMTDGLRQAVFGALGPGAYPFFQTVYICDLDLRLTAALTQLFNEPADPAPGPARSLSRTEPVDLWPAFDRFLAEVATLDRLDPVTTELVRLRGARAHNCRICQSRRSVSAIGGGADEATFDKIDLYESSDLDVRSKVALRLTDALLWQPADYPAGLVAQVRATFSPAETVEIVLDVVRNAANKVAVALGADEAVVTSGVEYFTLAPDGTLTYGVQAPVGAPAR